MASGPRGGRRVAILQSNYIPWKGYFDLIHDVDLFVFYDDNQYTSRDWRNRNKVKTAQGPSWITVPVGHDRERLICEVEIPESTWQAKHWRPCASSAKPNKPTSTAGSKQRPWPASAAHWPPGKLR